MFAGPITEAVINGHKQVMQPFVYLLGNPFVWWFSTFCFAISPLVFLSTDGSFWKFQRHLHLEHASPTAAFPRRFSYLLLQVYIGWVASILPYALISRACFIYHYMPSLIFAVIITGVVADCLVARFSVPPFVQWAVVMALVSAFMWAFWFFIPLSYGTPMTRLENHERRWFEGWN